MMRGFDRLEAPLGVSAQPSEGPIAEKTGLAESTHAWGNTAEQSTTSLQEKGVGRRRLIPAC